MKYWQIAGDANKEPSDTPERLWNNACKYFKFCDENPITGTESVKSGENAGTKFTVEKHRAYSLKGVCIYCGINENYIRDVLQMGAENGGDFYYAIERIMYVIQVQNFELAAAGFLQQQFMGKFIIATEPPQRQLPVRVEVVGGLPELSSNENEILDSVELEMLSVVKSAQNESKEQSEK